MTKPQPRRFKLRTLFSRSASSCFSYRLAGVYVFRIYENELVKQTELELIAQAALIAAIYKNEAQEVVKQSHRENGTAFKLDLPTSGKEYYRPIKPQLNLSAYRLRRVHRKPANGCASEMTSPGHRSRL